MRVRVLAVMLLALLPVSALAETPQPVWIADPRTGCQVWNSNPEVGDTISWSGGCQLNLANGTGVLQWYHNGRPNGRYEGEYRDGKANGHGDFTSADGTRYEGEFRDDEANGHGVASFANGARYEGDYRNGKFDGQGVFTSADGTRYEGEWRDDTPNGGGIMTWPDGARYEGKFRDGKANGPGRLTQTDGTTFNGIWSNGCFTDRLRRAAAGVDLSSCP
jgi:hypothetical protein